MVGQRIKQYIEENGIKQTFVANKVGITPSQFNLLCNTDRKIDCITYFKICKVLGVPLEYFVEGEAEE